MLRLIVLVFALALAAPMASLGSTVDPAVPIDRPPPIYPDTADEVSGHVKIQFDIDAEGHVRGPVILESVPPGVFDASVLAAIATWRYQPRRVDGKPVLQPNNAVNLEFVPPPPDPAKTVTLKNDRSDYTREAYLAGREGDVTVGFDIDENGLVENAHVLRSTIPEVFDANAISEVENTRFDPPLVDGAPTGVTGLSTTIEFRLARATIKPERLDNSKLSYPETALRNGQEGYCHVINTIAGDGTVEKAELIATLPMYVFRQACLKFAWAARYEAPDQDPTGRLGRTADLMIRFRIYDSRSLLRPGQWAKIRYTIGTAGETKDVEVVAVSDPDVPVAKVVAAIRRRVVKPIVENGVAVEKPNRIILMTSDRH
jgi:TonB family protein